MTNDERWQPCTQGTIENLVETQKQSEQTQQLNRRALLTGSVAAVVGCGLLLFKTVSEDNPLTCAQVRELAQPYSHKELSAAETKRIDDHRQHCAACDQFLETLATGNVV